MNLLVLVGILVVCIINCFNSFVGYVPVKLVGTENVEAGEAVPILMFHHFVTDEKECDSGTTITDKKFQEVLNEIEELGYETISFKDLIDFTEYKKELPNKPILITMDDGYKSNYEIAFPLLKEKNMKATVSIIGKSTKYTSSYLKNKTLEHMSWEDLNEMIESGVFEVGNHTFDLHKLRSSGGSRNGITKNFFESEADYSKVVRADIDSLENALKVNCNNYKNNVFCYPYGYYDKLSEAIISGLGYKVTLTTDEGVNYIKPGDKLIGLKRINVSMETKISDYLK